MDEDVKNIIEKVKEVKKLAYDYIVNTEHFIFYWITNEEVRAFIENNPDVYEDETYISVEDVGEGWAKVRIQLGPYYEEEPEDNVIYRSCPLQGFRETVNREWLKFNGQLMKIRIEDAKRNLAFHKKKVEDLEYFINKYSK